MILSVSVKECRKRIRVAFNCEVEIRQAIDCSCEGFHLKPIAALDRVRMDDANPVYPNFGVDAFIDAIVQGIVVLSESPALDYDAFVEGGMPSKPEFAAQPGVPFADAQRNRIDRQRMKRRKGADGLSHVSVGSN